MDLTGKTAIVTGAGAGIGRETALLLARRGASVVVNARGGSGRDEDTVEEILAAGGRAALARGDVADPDPAGMEESFVRRQPIGRLGLPSEIAHAIAYVASEEAAFITGSVVVIDGGMTM